jgi:putative transposase
VKVLRATYQYKPKQRDDQPVIQALAELTEKHPPIGFWKCFHRARKQGLVWNYKREVLAIETDTSFPAMRVIRVLSGLLTSKGKPGMIRLDNGPEFISEKLDNWFKNNKIQLVFVQPGKPAQNDYIERLNGSLRNELLNAYEFRSLTKVREQVNMWIEDYYNHRPNESSGNKTSAEMKELVLENSNFEWPNL